MVFWSGGGEQARLYAVTLGESSETSAQGIPIPSQCAPSSAIPTMPNPGMDSPGLNATELPEIYDFLLKFILIGECPQHTRRARPLVTPGSWDRGLTMRKSGVQAIQELGRVA